jgi:hypothetical protein
MDSTSIELSGSRISAVEVDGDTVKVRFEPAYLVKTMTGSVERTRWWQNGYLVFEGAVLEDPAVLQLLPADCAGGDVGENVYTYRDMLPVPLTSSGHAHCDLHLKDSKDSLRIQAKGVHLDLEDVAKYIEHVRP